MASPQTVEEVVDSVAISVPGSAPFSAELEGTLTFPAPGVLLKFSCSFEGTSVAFVWVDGHMVCQDQNAYTPETSWTDSIIQSEQGRLTKPFRAHVYYNGSGLVSKRTSAKISLAVQWGPVRSAPVPIPLDALEPTLPALEMRRGLLQRGLARGWGSWLFPEPFTLVSAPSGIALATNFCRREGGGGCVPLGDGEPGRGYRLGSHAWDRSYGRYWRQLGALNVSVEFSGGGAGNLAWLLTAAGPSGGSAGPANTCEAFALSLEPRFLWQRGGSVEPAAPPSAGPHRILFRPAGHGAESEAKGQRLSTSLLLCCSEFEK